MVVNAPYIRFYAGCPLRDLNGHKLGTLCIIDQKPRVFEQEDIESLQDLASMVERELAAIQLATMDELTHISNRSGFMMLAQHSLNFCARQNVSASLIFLDLDKFKLINDNFGHAEGDRALVAFAGLLKSAHRDTDLFARIGGDEFVSLLANTSRQLAGNIVEKFSQSLAEYNQKSKRGYDIEFSHGVIEFKPEQHLSIENLMVDGDSLMYEVKNSKR